MVTQEDKDSNPYSVLFCDIIKTDYKDVYLRL